MLQALKPHDYVKKRRFLRTCKKPGRRTITLKTSVFSVTKLALVLIAGSRGTMYRYRVQKNPQDVVKNERDFAKIIFLCVVSHNKMYGPFIFGTVNVTGISYLDIKMENDINGFIYQHDRSPPHWHKEIPDYLN